jgi:hypothetical protein
MAECNHNYVPVNLIKHPNNPKLRLAVFVCANCYRHKYRFSKGENE